MATKNNYLFMGLVQSGSTDIIKLHLDSGDDISSFITLKNGNQISADFIQPLYNKPQRTFKLPNLTFVFHGTNKVPFCDYSNLKKLIINYSAVKHVNINKLVDNGVKVTVFNVKGVLSKLFVAKIMRRYPNSSKIDDELNIVYG
jgi:hypothetical protein